MFLCNTGDRHGFHCLLMLLTFKLNESYHSCIVYILKVNQQIKTSYLLILINENIRGVFILNEQNTLL